MTLELNRFGLGDEKYSHTQIASTLSDRIQQLIILPTEKCNFRCTYCYEDFQIGKMKEPVQASIERFLDKRIPELSELSIQWFGGEPLVAKDIVLRLSAHANRLCQDYGVSFSGGLTTNAYVLTPELFDELLSNNQKFFQITFDGWQLGHDSVRKLANGKGSFDRIWENLCATKRSAEQFKIQIRIHVRRDNYKNLEILLENLAREFGADPRYSLDFQHLRNLGGEGGKSVNRPLSLAELREAEAQLRSFYDHLVARPGDQSDPQYQIDNGTQPVESKPISGSHSAPYICYAAKPNSLLIRADGRIGKCTVALDDDRNTIGRISHNGALIVETERLQPWVRGLSKLDHRELSCPLVGLPHVRPEPH